MGEVAVSTWDDNRAEAESHRLSLEEEERKRHTQYPLEEVLAWLSPGTMQIGSSYNAWGDVHFTLIFADYRERARFLRNFHGVWIVTGDRANFMNYQNKWNDTNGAGLMLGSTDYPLRALGGRRNGEIRIDRRRRRVRPISIYTVLAKLDGDEIEFLRDEFLRAAEAPPEYPDIIDDIAMDAADLIQDVIEISRHGHTTTERTV